MSVEVSVGYMSVGWACGRARGRGALGEGPSGEGVEWGGEGGEWDGRECEWDGDGRLWKSLYYLAPSEPKFGPKLVMPRSNFAPRSRVCDEEVVHDPPPAHRGALLPAQRQPPRMSRRKKSRRIRRF
jgi:hypothetical protein